MPEPLEVWLPKEKNRVASREQKIFEFNEFYLEETTLQPISNNIGMDGSIDPISS